MQEPNREMTGLVAREEVGAGGRRQHRKIAPWTHQGLKPTFWLVSKYALGNGRIAVMQHSYHYMMQESSA
jgi:hypothetical protein